MALTPEKYLESLWTDDDNETQEAPVLQQDLAESENAAPSYHELMGAGEGAISLRRTPPTNNKNSARSPKHPSTSGAPPKTSMPRNAKTSLAGPHSPVAPAAAADPATLKQQLDTLLRDVEGSARRYDAALLEARKAAEVVRSLEAEISSLQVEAEELSRRMPPAPERQHQVRSWLADRRQQLAGVRDAASERQMSLIAAEAELRAAEQQLDWMAETRAEVEAAAASEVATGTANAAALRTREARAVSGYKRQQAQQAKALAEAQEEAEATARQRVAVAAEARQKTLERLKSDNAKSREALTARTEAAAAAAASRRQAVLGLKSSMAVVSEEVAAAAELAAVLQRQRREQQDKEFGALTEAGLNPYEVFRRRDQQEMAARQHANIKANIASRQLALAAQLAREQEMYNGVMLARQKEKADRVEFDREMGVAARQARNEAYMTSHTLAGQSMLDPTGRLPVFPSQATLVKDAHFGRGGAPDALLDRQTARLGPVTPQPLLLPAKYRSQEHETGGRGAWGSDDEGGGMGSPPCSPRPSGIASMPSQSHSQSGFAPSPAGADRYKLLATRPLTKFEQAMMEAAKTRHKQGIGSAKTQMGRTFGGDAFLASPPVIEFKDFDVGRTVTASVQIINRSYQKNTFRVIGIPVEHGDILDFSYDLPGYLAPGVSGEVRLAFSPKAPVDVDTCLQLLADTGPFVVPIQCRTKRVSLSMTPADGLDFGPGGVTLGDSASRTFVIANDGALEVEFRLDSPQLTDDERSLLKSSANLNFLAASATAKAAAAAITAAALPATNGPGSSPSRRSLSTLPSMSGATAAGPPVVVPREQRVLTHGGFSVFPCVGTLRGYSKVTFTVTFAPVVAAAARLDLTVQYKAPSQKRLSLPLHSLSVTATGREVPVYLERPLLDFKCCLMGHMYRDVHNGGKTAMKVTVVPRPELEGFFEFTPDFGFVQAGSSFPISVRFKPSAALLTACRRHLQDPEEDQILEIPMRLSVPDQTLPVSFTLRAELTHTDLAFFPPLLDFGACVLSERTALRLAIHNPGRLPQAFGFVTPPPGVSITPNDGYGYILPGKTLHRLVAFQPPIPGPQNFELRVATLAGRSFSLACRATGLVPPLSLSSNRVAMPATAVGDTSTVSVVLVNRSDEEQAFEFALPPNSDLTFSPHVGSVPSQSRLRVQIDYSPRAPDPSQIPQNTHAPASPSSPVGGPHDPALPGGGGEADADGYPSDLDEPNEPIDGADGTAQNGPGGDGRAREGPADRWPGLRSPLDGDEAWGGQGGGGGRGLVGGGPSLASLRSSRTSVSFRQRAVDDEEDDDLENAAGAGGRFGGRLGSPGDSDEGKDGGQGDTTGGGPEWGPPPTPSPPRWYRFRDHTITCFIRPPPTTTATKPQAPQQTQHHQPPEGDSNQPQSTSGGGSTSTELATRPQELHLQLSTCALLPDLVLQTQLPYVAVHQCHCLDFGPVPVGQRVVRMLEVVNEGSEPMTLSSEALDSSEVFCLVNALRVVQPGTAFRVLLAFTPQARKPYLEVLVVKSTRTKLRVALKGAGIAPELQLTPEGVTATGLDFGDVLVGESAVRPLTLTNICPFPLAFSLVMAGRPTAADPNVGMRPPFSFAPAEGTLAQGESCEVVVTFSPYSQRPYYEDMLQVIVPNQQEQLQVPLRGRGWQEGVFIAGPTYPETDPDPFQLYQLAAAERLPLPAPVATSRAGAAAAAAVAAAAATAGGGSGPGGKPITPGKAGKAAAGAPAPASAAASSIVAEPRVLTLTFPDAVYGGEMAKVTFEVGSLKSVVQGLAAGEVVIGELSPESREEGWALIDTSGAVLGSGPLRVALAAGELRSITLSYSAPRQPHAAMVASYSYAEYRTLHLSCNLRGGLPVLAGGPDGRNVVLVARCRLLPGTRPEGEALPPSVTEVPVPVASGGGEGGGRKGAPVGGSGTATPKKATTPM